MKIKNILSYYWFLFYIYSFDFNLTKNLEMALVIYRTTER